MKNHDNLKNNLKANLKVYFDGLCKVCSREINHYKKQNGAEKIEFIDICSPDFNALKENVDPIQVHKIMHVRRTDGSIATKVDAFIEIWNALPKYKILSKIAKNPVVRFGLDLSYTGFTLIRPALPRYANYNECKDSPYCEIKRK